jgi:hypothetical protein
MGNVFPLKKKQGWLIARGDAGGTVSNPTWNLQVYLEDSDFSPPLLAP